jgi:hypothetical protein
MNETQQLDRLLKKHYQELQKTFVNLSVKIDSGLGHRIMLFSEQLKIPAWLVIQNLLLADWARRVASFEVEGADHVNIMPEFQWRVLDNGNRELITGEELYRVLVEYYKQEIKVTKPQVGENTFSHLSDNTREIMEKAYSEALKNPAEGQKILQNAVNKTKQLK